MSATVRSLVVVALFMAACAAPAAPSPSPSCAQAFGTAVGTGTGDEGVAFNALRPVFKACTTVDEWTTEWTRRNGLGYIGAATEVLGQMCQLPDVRDERLCIAARPATK